MNKLCKVYFLQNKINRIFTIISRSYFKLKSSIMGTNTNIQYPSHILYTQFSNQLTGNTLNTLSYIAFTMTAISPLFSNYYIKVFSLPLSCSFTSFSVFL